jgi:hypothetical protein
MTRSRQWKLAAAAVLTAGAFAGAALTLVAFAGGWSPIPVAEADDQKAYALLNGPTSPASVAAAEAAARRTLALAPYSNAARLRLAYIDTLRHGGSLGPEGRAELARSYDLVALDHTVAAWRVRFALDHWRELPPELREQVHQEVMAFGRLGSRDADVRMSLRAVRSPEGRVAATLWLTALALERLPSGATSAQVHSAVTSVTPRSQ